MDLHDIYEGYVPESELKLHWLIDGNPDIERFVNFLYGVVVGRSRMYLKNGIVYVDCRRPTELVEWLEHKADWEPSITFFCREDGEVNLERLFGKKTLAAQISEHYRERLRNRKGGG